MSNAPKTVERVVRARFVRYTEMIPVPGKDDEFQPVMRSGHRGATINVLETEEPKLARSEAFFTDQEVTRDESGEPVVEVDIHEMSDTDLAEWIKNDKPTVSDVVEAAGDDPRLAERLMAAEAVATGGKSRKGVNDGLTVIIDKHAAGNSGVEPTGAP